MGFLFTYLDSMDIEELEVDFLAARQEQLELSRMNVDEQIDLIEELRDSMPDASWEEIGYELFAGDYLTDDQFKHINHFQEKSGVTQEETLEVLFDAPNRAVAYYVLGREVERTGYQEKHQYSVLQDSQFYDEDTWVDLPNSGRNALYLGEGGYAVSRDEEPHSSHSLDFHGMIWYPAPYDPDNPTQEPDYTGCQVELNIAAKYTQNRGGSQNLQADNLESFAQFAAPRGYGNPITVLLADGNYYVDNSRRRYGKRNYDDYIYDKYPQLNLIVTNSAMFDYALADFIMDLLEEKLIEEGTYEQYCFSDDNDGLYN